MLPGVSGSLLTPSFLERYVEERLRLDAHAARRLRPVYRWWRQVERTMGPATSVRALADRAALPLLEQHAYHVTHLEPAEVGLVGQAVRRGNTSVALRIAPWGADLDRAWRETVRAGRNAGARWAIVLTGNRLRVVDADRTWSRRALDFDLLAVMRDERSAHAFVAILDAVGAEGAGALGALVSESERHGSDVCGALGAGVLEALTAVFAHLNTRTLAVADRERFEQAVTIVYRLLFLLFAEARALVPTWHRVYREAYSIDALCRRTLTQPERPGLWKALQAISRLAHRGCRAGDLMVTAFNGRLFSPRHTPLAEQARISDAAIGRAVIALATTPRHGARERIAYADLGVEQLGAVYERVLEYEPTRTPQGPQLTRTSLDRKSTGSFYTPRSVTDFLVRRALHPLVSGRSAEAILQLRIVDPAMGSGAFLVAACRYLADAVERALLDEGALTPDRTAAERANIRRLVAQRCLYGVDLNRMAVQLARLSLWLASLSSEQPLTFLDHRLGTGNSLLGASLRDLARDPLGRWRPATPRPLFDEHDSETFATHILPARFRLAMLPDDTPAAVHAKERALAALTAQGSTVAKWKDAADLWCAASFWESRFSRGAFRDVVGTLQGRPGALRGRQRDAILARARTIADAEQFFHWELEFPEVFFDDTGQRAPDGGFDAVIGNPPWEMLRADFGGRRDRDRQRARHRAGRRFFRDAGIYVHQGSGHVNSYQLFIERALQLLKPSGRLALIVPSGLATDQGCSELRRALVEQTSIDNLIGFDNRAAIFPIHRDLRFLLLTATKGGVTERVTCTFGHSDPRELDTLPDDRTDDPPQPRTVTFAITALRGWDPDHLSIPWLTTRTDLEILTSISSRIPPLGAVEGWNVKFGRELNASEDREHFAPHATGVSLLPIVEGKHLEPFRALTASSRLGIAPRQAARLLDPARTFGRARLAYRDVASATNRLTLIAVRLPAGVVSTHTVFCSKDTLGEDAQYCLLALLNSLVANYLVRLRVTTHVTTAVMSRLYVPKPPSRSSEFRTLAELARDFERSGVAGRDVEYAKLNALVARLYGLTPAQYAHVVSTFPLLRKQGSDPSTGPVT